MTFAPLKRQAIPLLLGVAGGTGSGKTYSALRLARGLADGQPFAGIDTENGRMSHYADLFPECHSRRITAPFRPMKYADAIEEADAYLTKQNIPAGNRVVVVDSASHEWAGDGGCLDWQEEIMDGKEARRLMSWIEPKKAHKRMVTRLLQLNAHVILCFRAEPKVAMVDDPAKPGKKKFIDKPSLVGLNGWIPISEKMLPYELTASFLVMADKPGIPLPIKLQEQHRAFVPLDKPLSEDTGRLLGEWAKGSVGETGARMGSAPVERASTSVEAASPTVQYASEDARKFIWKAAREAGLSQEDLQAIVVEVTGQEKASLIRADMVQLILDRVVPDRQGVA